MDKLIVTGLEELDGEYDCDFTEMTLLVGEPQSLTNAEGHRIKTMTGVRAGELYEALTAGDNDVLVALAAIILTRAGKRFDESRLWDAKIGAIDFKFESPAGGDVQVPPAERTAPDEPSTNGGGSGGPESGQSPNGPSGTGQSTSPTSPVASDLPISAI